MTFSITPFLSLFLISCAQDPGEMDAKTWNDTYGESSGMSRKESPCTTDDEPEVGRSDSGETWAACDDGSGLYSVSSSGEFALSSDSEGMVFSTVRTDSQGRLLIGGTDSDGNLVTGTVDIDSPVADLNVVLLIGNDFGAPRGTAASDDTQILISENGQTLAVEGLLGWSEEESWTAEADAWLNALVQTEEGLSGIGGDGEGNATVFVQNDAEELSFEAMTWSEAQAELMDTADSAGGLWVVGADAEGEAMASLCPAACTVPENWQPQEVDMPGGMVVSSLSFDSSGLFGVMTGSDSASASGMVLLSSDAGVSWEEVDADFPPLSDASVDETGDFVVSGQSGFVASGSIQ